MKSKPIYDANDNILKIGDIVSSSDPIFFRYQIYKIDSEGIYTEHLTSKKYWFFSQDQIKNGNLSKEE